MLKEAPPREGFFEEDQYEAVRRRLPPDLRVAVAIAHTFGWRVRSEVLPLQRRHVDLKAGTLRLDPGTTKNAEGRVVYLTPALKAALAEQQELVDALGRRIGQIIPWVFPHLGGRRAGGGAGRSGRPGRPRAGRPACRVASSTTSAARPSATLSGPACPGPWP